MIRLVNSDFHGGRTLRTFQSAETAARYYSTHNSKCTNGCVCGGPRIVCDNEDKEDFIVALNKEAKKHSRFSIQHEWIALKISDLRNDYETV